MKPKISINYEKTKELTEKLWKTQTLFSSDEFERSDLIYCPIKAYNRFMGIEPDYSSKLIAIFLIGETLHELMQKVFKHVEVKEQLLPNTNFRFDVVWDKIAEIKTTISQMIHPSHIKQSYLDQLECALCFKEENSAYLITLDIVTKALIVWDIEWPKEYLEEQSYYYKCNLQLLEEAVRTKNPLILEPHFDECQGCWYFIDCEYLKKFK